jgi:hypothetical protein
MRGFSVGLRVSVSIGLRLCHVSQLSDKRTSAAQGLAKQHLANRSVVHSCGVLSPNIMIARQPAKSPAAASDVHLISNAAQRTAHPVTPHAASRNMPTTNAILHSGLERAAQNAWPAIIIVLLHLSPETVCDHHLQQWTGCPLHSPPSGARAFASASPPKKQNGGLMGLRTPLHQALPCSRASSLPERTCTAERCCT